VHHNICLDLVTSSSLVLDVSSIISYSKFDVKHCGVTVFLLIYCNLVPVMVQNYRK
jgi:hypothetical protein